MGDSARAAETETGAATSARPSSLGDLLEAAAAATVAVRVEREKDGDLPAARVAQRLRPNEAKAYFQRPKDVVSGFVVDTSGLILTSLYNVAGKLKSITVILPDGTEHAAEIRGRSELDDVALLAIRSESNDDEERGETNSPAEQRNAAVTVESAPMPRLTALPLAAAGKPRAGQFVYALGRSPDPRRLTVTRGIVSAMGRNGGRAFQTDAELNYGNVGGPLLNLSGEVVAIASFVGHHQPQWGINSGVGFGTTISTLLEILPRLKRGETISAPPRTFLGIYWDQSDFRETGALVRDVFPDSGAAKAGLRGGDRILKIDGIEIDNFDHLRRVIFFKKPGDSIHIELLRDGDALTTDAVLGARRNP